MRQGDKSTLKDIGKKVALAISMAAVCVGSAAAGPIAPDADQARVWFGGAGAGDAAIVNVRRGGEERFDENDKTLRRLEQQRRARIEQRGGVRYDPRGRGRYYKHPRYYDYYYDGPRYYKRKHRDDNDAAAIIGGLLAAGVAAAVISEATKGDAPVEQRYSDCDRYADACAKNWGTRNSNFDGCMRYHGCN